ncbi:hypothetical protein C8A00DRAFT_15254 [Chaetomidium leptoderma]|uniref:Protein kinase domain-containing protein n=1 Tax=Chaetomidium leptoderma TaxID=669021 RepID=A0AAN6ZX43_9PEZI|nr:hypothetical protein C8A00DRAFT_15254 [Chaetomidium leptoderma]
MFKSGERRLLFIRNFGSGVESVAQLVKDVDSGEVLIRKVTASRLVGNGSPHENRPFKKPHEIQMLDAIRTTLRPSAEPHLRPYIAECYGHEYIRSEDVDPSGRTKYHSVSYWKLYNGRAIKTQWLSNNAWPPAVVVARMIRQVLSTLHHLYTAGEQPIYHEDSHFGNIWMHWKADALLPDFYLGDFADASFANSQSQLLEERPVNDLHKIWQNLQLAVDILGSRRGYGDAGAKALRKLTLDISKTIHAWKGGCDLDTPPDLIPLINWAQDLEELFGEGGIADETKSPAYAKFLAEERTKALRVERERALMVETRHIHKALRPKFVLGSASIPMTIHGPWQLVRAGDLTPVEADGVTHHRPNRSEMASDEDISNTKKRLGRFSPLFIESDSCEEANAFTSSHRSILVVVNPDPQPQDPPPPSPAPPNARLAPPDDAQEPSPTFSFTPGDDAAFQHTQPEESQEPSPTFSFTPGDDAGFHSAGSHNLGGLWLSHWHALVHGEDCGCSEEVWASDVEAMLRSRRTGAVVTESTVSSMHLGDPGEVDQ